MNLENQMLGFFVLGIMCVGQSLENKENHLNNAKILIPTAILCAPATTNMDTNLI